MRVGGAVSDKRGALFGAKPAPPEAPVRAGQRRLPGGVRSGRKWRSYLCIRLSSGAAQSKDTCHYVFQITVQIECHVTSVSISAAALVFRTFRLVVGIEIKHFRNLCN